MTFAPEAINQLSSEERVRSYDEMPGLIQQLGRVGLQVFLVQGVFDIVHAGHTGLLRAARRLAPTNAVLVVGLENDTTVRINKGDRRPVNPLPDRLQVVSEFRSVGFVFGYDDTPRYDHPEDYVQRWQSLRPAAVVAATWDPHRHLKEWQAQQAGTQLALAEYRHQNSTTRMLQIVGYEE